MPVSTTTGYRVMRNENNSVGGIDFSINHPAICVHKGDAWSVDNCTFYVLDDDWDFPSYSGKIKVNPQITGYVNNVDRWYQLSNYVVDILIDVNNVYLEDYAYSSSGLVFQIAEATGVLKHHLNRKMKNIFPPKSVKKFATTNGNANKELMYEKFVAETSMDLIGNSRKIKTGNQYKGTKIPSPFSDIVDSYFICKMGFNEINS